MVVTSVLFKRLGAYSDVKATKFGNTPPIPKPAIKRKIPNSVGVVVNPPKNVKALNKETQIKITFLRPILSASIPNKIGRASCSERDYNYVVADVIYLKQHQLHIKYRLE